MWWPLAQLAERLTLNQKVPRSTRGRPANFNSLDISDMLDAVMGKPTKMTTDKAILKILVMTPPQPSPQQLQQLQQFQQGQGLQPTPAQLGNLQQGSGGSYGGIYSGAGLLPTTTPINVGNAVGPGLDPALMEILAGLYKPPPPPATDDNSLVQSDFAEQLAKAQAEMQAKYLENLAKLTSI